MSERAANCALMEQAIDAIVSTPFMEEVRRGRLAPFRCDQWSLDAVTVQVNVIDRQSKTDHAVHMIANACELP